MRPFSFLSFTILASALTACGGNAPEANPPVSYTQPVEAPAASAPAAAQPSPEEQKKAASAAKLEADRAKLKSDHEKELARFTPELKAQVKTLADKNYATGKAAITAMTKSSHRQPGNAERDSQRHPIETLEFFGFKPTQSVFEYGPGGGWYTELLAPALAKKGKLVINNGDANGPKDQRSTYYAERVVAMLETSPELYGKVQTVQIADNKAPKLGLDGKLDLALVIRGLHGMVSGGSMQAWINEIHTALKPKGVLGIVAHRAKEGSDPIASSKKGYLPEKWVIEQIEANGFKLTGKSEINANPKDTADYPEGVWALPPSLERGDKDRAQLSAIGETDRMTLRFVKVEASKTK